MRISNSFTDGEVQVLEFILNQLLRGTTPTTATRHRDFASVYRKVLHMKKRVEEQQQKRQAGDQASSSVGTVEAAQPGEASDQGDSGDDAGHKEAV